MIHDYKPRTVVVGYGARTAIIIAVGRTKVHYIPMEEGQLVVRKEDIRLFAFTRELDYPIKRACRLYLKHSGGLSVAARDALTRLRRES